jgi:hypothetical protein
MKHSLVIAGLIIVMAAACATVHQSSARSSEVVVASGGPPVSSGVTYSKPLGLLHLVQSGQLTDGTPWELWGVSSNLGGECAWLTFANDGRAPDIGLANCGGGWMLMAPLQHGPDLVSVGLAFGKFSAAEITFANHSVRRVPITDEAYVVEWTPSAPPTVATFLGSHSPARTCDVPEGWATRVTDDSPMPTPLFPCT